MGRSSQFLFVFVFMILYVVMGTLLHESGHILIAKVLGYHSILHYGSMNWYPPDGAEGTDPAHSFYITLGGVVLLDVISLVALGVLVFKGKQLSQWLFWLLVFLAMLIYRHIVLSVICLGLIIIDGRPIAYGSDEKEIAHYLSVSNSVVGIPLLIVAFVSCYVLFFVVFGKEYRYRFLIAGGIGGIIGYTGWLYFIGPLVMP
ncbi:MAG: hypothetical protein JWO03_498 [Bacteroidetes bacterium]|nr:hypothetical protein [Bacteroidota bacterium]